MGKQIKTPKKEDDITNTKNTKIIIQFQKLVEQIQFDIDHSTDKKQSLINFYRLRQIRNAINIIKSFPNEIKKGEQLQSIKGIGKGTISRINEILDTGRLSEIRVSKKHQQYLDQIEELEQIFGIGRKTAYELITVHNIKSIQQLKDAYNEGLIDLNDQILLGLKYHGVFKENIPRSEVDKINNLIQLNIKKVHHNLNAIICGSYRRLKSTSNDIDILLTHNDIKTKLDLKLEPNYLIKFVEQLKKIKFIKDDITYEDYESKYMGFCQLVIK
jgi:DNA polymerase/3'-5' exonuclease PolX